MKLCLGTVQFGMDYGIRNQKKPMLERSVEMLDYATQNGIDTLDTANAYGNAEEVLGTFLSRHTVSRNKLRIISKVKPNILDAVDESKYFEVIKNNFEVTTGRLGIDYLDGYLFHSSRYIFCDAMLDALNEMKKRGYVKKIGVSVYEPEEAKEGLGKGTIDLVQLPFSIFDQRMLDAGIFELAKKSNVEVHSRSAFIQGLILMREEEVPEFLHKAIPILERIDVVCKEYEINRIQLAMGYVKCQSSISNLVFGVDTIDQLREDINYFEQGIPERYINEIGDEFKGLDADLVMPSLWKK